MYGKTKNECVTQNGNRGGMLKEVGFKESREDRYVCQGGVARRQVMGVLGLEHGDPEEGRSQHVCSSISSSSTSSPPSSFLHSLSGFVLVSNMS